MTQTLQQIIDANPEAETFRFGDSPELCAEILALVRSGVKTATCDAAASYGAGKDAWPEVGRRNVALNWDGTPAVMVETVEVFTRRFNEMDEAFVAAQGEFRDLAHWRNGYEAYFRRAGLFAPDMKLMCERFKLVEDFCPSA
ncbi:ASCH domain-containing protein [Sulfitobacter sp. HNIBRBA2951]|uniref:ASCH domain-containing protein n=1 Tax=Sulfitobacter aquimarinus TaxID=3158557 RepID=UPI0032DE3D0E